MTASTAKDDIDTVDTESRIHTQFELNTHQRLILHVSTVDLLIKQETCNGFDLEWDIL